MEPQVGNRVVVEFGHPIDAGEEDVEASFREHATVLEVFSTLRFVAMVVLVDGEPPEPRLYVRVDGTWMTSESTKVEVAEE